MNKVYFTYYYAFKSRTAPQTELKQNTIKLMKAKKNAQQIPAKKLYIRNTL